MSNADYAASRVFNVTYAQVCTRVIEIIIHRTSVVDVELCVVWLRGVSPLDLWRFVRAVIE